MEIVSYLIEAHIFGRSEKGIEFLIMKRSEEELYPNIWQMVTGSIKEGEKAYQAALREIKEETGLTPVRLWVVPLVNSFYSHQKENICLVPVFAAEVIFDSAVEISSEHSEYKWMTADEAKKHLAWEGQRKAVDLIVEYFVDPGSELKFMEIEVESE